MINEEQRLARRKYIGSSDAAAILGVDPFKNAADVYWSKVGGAPSKENDAMEAGNLLEPVVRDWASEKLNKILLVDQFRVRGDVLCANHDALVHGEPQGVEVKTTGIVGPVRSDFGEEGTDEVPDFVNIQCQHQMLVSDLELVWVPVLIGCRGFVMYRVERNEPIIKTLDERLPQWWQDHVVKGVPPADVIPSIETIKRIHREPNKCVQVPTSIVEEWINCKEVLAMHKRDYEQAQALLLNHLGDAEAGDCSLGRVTYYEQKRVGYEVIPTTFRVLREPKKK